MEIIAHRFVASSPRGFGDLLAAELRSFGAADVRERALGVEFTGSLEVAYRACLESRVGSRVFLVVAQFTRRHRRKLLRSGARRRLAQAHRCRRARWPAIFPANIPRSRTRASVRCASRTPSAISCATRPAAAPTSRPSGPRVRVHAHANGPNVTISIDLSGEGLHRRGYRAQAGEAPLRENLAAGILLRAGWPEKCKRRRGVSRSHVRLGHAGHRSGHDRGQRRARRAPSLFRFPRLGGSRPRRLGASETRCAGARAEAVAAIARCRCGCIRAGGGARQRRARRPG